jgi:cytochrome c biogenesis protein CcdA
MSDWFSRITSTLIAVGGLIMIGHGFRRSFRERRFTHAHAARISFGFAFLILVAPTLFYPSLGEDGRNSIQWVAGALLAVSLLFEFLSRRSRPTVSR